MQSSSVSCGSHRRHCSCKSMTSPTLFPLGTLKGGAMSRLPSTSGFHCQQPMSPESEIHCRSCTKPCLAASPRAPLRTSLRASASGHLSAVIRSCLPTRPLRAAPSRVRPWLRAIAAPAMSCTASQARLSIFRAARKREGMRGFCLLFSGMVRSAQALSSAAYMARRSSCCGSSARSTPATSPARSAPSTRSSAASGACPTRTVAMISGEMNTGPSRPACCIKTSAVTGRLPAAFIILSTSIPNRSRLTLVSSSRCMSPLLAAASTEASRRKSKRAANRKARSILRGSSRNVSLAGSGVLMIPSLRSAKPLHVKSSTLRVLRL
mmetsp:Transcript_3984/g.11053  ORF Transcript_3984/g.11053 Transcript_3984/m.11053 type:complete len:323 (+) Transcript_3984:331-1299(+)